MLIGIGNLLEKNQPPNLLGTKVNTFPPFIFQMDRRTYKIIDKYFFYLKSKSGRSVKIDFPEYLKVKFNQYVLFVNKNYRVLFIKKERKLKEKRDYYFLR